MLFRLRSASGRDFIAGNWIDAEGGTRQLAAEDVSVEPLAWTKLASTTLPTRWRVGVKSRGWTSRRRRSIRRVGWRRALPIGRADPLHRLAQRRGYLEMTGY